MNSRINQEPNSAPLGAGAISAPDARIAPADGAFHQLSDEELAALSGAGLWSWLKDAAGWVADHFGYSGTDMTGGSATIISVKGTWRGNP